MRLLLSFFFLPLISMAQGWLRLPDWPASRRDDGVGVAVGDKAYFGTGLQEWNATIDFQALDLKTLSWSAIPNLPNTKERQYACAFAGNDCFYVTCGLGVGGALNNTYKYSISSNSWTPSTAKPGAGIYGAACLTFPSFVILAGGHYDNGKPSYEVWKFDLSTEQWQQKNNFPFASVHRAAGAGAYLLGGIDSLSVFRKELYEYQPGTDQWTLAGQLPVARGRAYMSMHWNQQQLFVFGGFDSLSSYYNDCFFYRPASQQWLSGLSMPAAGRRGGMSAMAGNNFYYVAGLSAAGRLTETWMTDVPTALQKISPYDQLKIYFSDDELLVKSGQAVNRINIYNLLGQPLFEFCSQESGDLHIPCAIPPGLYMIRLTLADGRLADCKLLKN